MSDTRIITKAASMFVFHAIQEWGQSIAERLAAVQGVLDAAGFEAQATCWPIFGGVWPKGCAGPEGPAATAWLTSLTKTMQRGQFEHEVNHVLTAIRERRAEVTA